MDATLEPWGGEPDEIDLIVGEPTGLYGDLDDPQAIERIYLGW